MSWYKSFPDLINPLNTLVYEPWKELLIRQAEGNTGNTKSRETNKPILDKYHS